MSKRMCGECRYLDHNQKKEGTFWCEEKRCWMPANSEEADNCRRFWGHSTYAGKEAGEAAIKESKKYQEDHRGYRSFSWFYISTAVLNILKDGESDDLLDSKLTKLQQFRLEYLQESTNLKDWLLEYDTVGPAIASAIKNDPNAKEIASDIYLCYLSVCLYHIDKKDYDGAFTVYNQMVEKLKEHYAAKSIIPEEVKVRYDQQNGGNGSIKLKPIS